MGISMLKDILKLPCLELHWSTQNPLIATPGVSGITTRVWFEQLLCAYT